MPASPTTQQMGELHEVFLAEVNDGSKSVASGSQWKDPADGRNSGDIPFPFAWDGKSTLGKGITITREMISKIREQALSLRPQIGLRWYGNGALDIVDEDWVAVPAADWAEVLEEARELVTLEAEHGSLPTYIARLRKAISDLRDEVATVETRLEGANTAADEARHRYQQLAEAASNGRIVPPAIPMLPWTLVYQVHLDGHVETSGMHYAADGRMTPFTVSTVRVERAVAGTMVPQPDGSVKRADGLPRLIVNDRLVSEGDLYVDGALHTRVSKSNPALAVG